jgi:hypothetical protein
MRKPRVKARKLVIPIAVTVAISTTAVTIATLAATVATSAGCDEDTPAPVDGGPPDTPII